MRTNRTFDCRLRIRIAEYEFHASIPVPRDMQLPRARKAGGKRMKRGVWGTRETSYSLIRKMTKWTEMYRSSLFASCFAKNSGGKNTSIFAENRTQELSLNLEIILLCKMNFNLHYKKCPKFNVHPVWRLFASIQRRVYPRRRKISLTCTCEIIKVSLPARLKPSLFRTLNNSWQAPRTTHISSLKHSSPASSCRPDHEVPAFSVIRDQLPPGFSSTKISTLTKFLKKTLSRRLRTPLLTPYRLELSLFSRLQYLHQISHNKPT